jgi:hypothetical protein
MKYVHFIDLEGNALNGERNDALYNNRITNVLCCNTYVYDVYIHEVCVEKMRAGESVCCDSYDGVPKATPKKIDRGALDILLVFIHKLGERTTPSPSALFGITSTPS